MIPIALSQTKLDTLESDPTIHLHCPIACPFCQKKVDVRIVLMGSHGDRDFTQRQVSPTMWNFSHLLDGLIGPDTSGKMIRVRLKLEQIARLRQRQTLQAKAPCPYCHLPLELHLQPANCS